MLIDLTSELFGFIPRTIFEITIIWRWMILKIIPQTFRIYLQILGTCLYYPCYWLIYCIRHEFGKRTYISIPIIYCQIHSTKNNCTRVFFSESIQKQSPCTGETHKSIPRLEKYSPVSKYQSGEFPLPRNANSSEASLENLHSPG